MIQFLINNNEIVLPEDFSFSWIEENHLISDSGEFSLDITASLLEPRNAIAFNFLNRKNKSDIKKTLDARLISDGRVYNGTIVIGKNTAEEVPFQFLAGKSEMKFIAKNENKVWMLDFGSEAEITFAQALESLNYPHYSPTRKYVCTPVKLGDVIVNDFDINLATVQGDIVIQPYLLYYINKLPELLGYSLKYNVLNTDERALRTFLVNAVKSLKYADALPDITVTKFIDDIEFFFNVSFTVNSRDKSISIIRLKEDIETKKVVTLTNVLDQYERDLSQESKTTRFDYTKIKYNLPTNDYFRYHCLSDDIIAKCEVIDFVDPFFADVSDENKLKIFHNSNTEDDWFARHLYNDASVEPKVPLFTIGSGTTLMSLINKFSAVGSSDDKVLSLDLIPAAMGINSFTVPAVSGTTNSTYQLPISSNSFFIPENLNFIDLVENGEKDINRLDKLEISLFWGKRNILKSISSGGTTLETPYPMSFNDFQPEPIWFTGLAPYTLKLKGVGGVVDDYKFENILDTSAEYSFTIIDGPDLTPDNLFVFDNMKYMPISFEREKSRVQKLVKGIFYRMKI